MVAGAGTGTWFKENYSIPVLTGAQTTTRLRTAHKQSAASTPAADQKDFAKPELEHTERSLQSMTDEILAKLINVQLGRKALARKKDGTEWKAVGSSAAAITYTRGASRTIVMYDVLFTARSSDEAFRGGTEEVCTPELESITHEFGHAIEGGVQGVRQVRQRTPHRTEHRIRRQQAGP
jgi:hypothetical protein